VDSEVMMGILARGGYELTPRADEAEVLVVNTCSFIEAAQKESVDAILEMAEHKKFGAAKKLIVAGCLVERFRAQILEQVPEVDAVVGTGEVERILEAVEGDLRMLPAQPPAFLYHDLTPRIVTTPKHAAYIKIAEGCDHPCTFCIIPQLRGKFRSAVNQDFIDEAKHKLFVRYSLVRNKEYDPASFPALLGTHLSGPARNFAVALNSNLRANMIHEARFSSLYGEYRSEAYFQGQGAAFNKAAGITG
jgi:hypothetical protein